MSMVKFFLDGNEVEAQAGETIWQVAQKHGKDIPHLCYSPEPGYLPDGNCRACMVEIEGERVLSPSCCRHPSNGMKVQTESDRSITARKMVMELLVADQPAREVAHDKNSKLWQWADKQNVVSSRFPKREAPKPDCSHSSMLVNLDACISCKLCVQACRDVQVNEVIGMANRGSNNSIVFDFNDPMGDSTCVACGECVQACPTGALMPATLVNESGVGIIAKGASVDKKVDSICPYCGVGCQITYNIKDNKILFVEGSNGPSNQNRLCVKGRFGFDYVTHADRLTKPLIRKAGVPKVANDQFDPANPYTHFRDATWEEALDFAASGLRKVGEQHGKYALAGFGSAKCSNEEAYLFQKLVRTGFGTNNVDHCTRLCHASSVAALLECVGSGAVSASFMEVKNADVAIMIGTNSHANHPVAATLFKNAAKRGTKIVLMDPRATAMRKYASHVLQFSPGADVILLNAMMHVIVEEKLYHTDYINEFTEGFENLKTHLKDYSPEKMSPQCGIAPEKIREVARLYATAKSAIIFWGMGISQHAHGTDNARCLISLSLMCGQIGRPGTGLHPLRGQNNVQGASDAGLIPMMYPDYNRVTNKEAQTRFEKLWGMSLDDKPGLTVVEIINAACDGKIKGMYIMGENPAMSDPDADHARQGLASLDHLVVQDLFLTETAIYADVVLPASAWPEKDGTVSNSNRQVQMGRQALPLAGDSRPDWWITQELATRLGLKWNYKHPKDVYAEMQLAMPSLDNISWTRLQKENSVTYPCAAPDQLGQDVVFTDGFPTATKRGKFVPAAIVPPDELPDTQYPMVLSTGRVLEHWHTGSMTRRASKLDDLEPVAMVDMNSADLVALNIEPGDTVRVSTRRGHIDINVRVDNNVAKGSLFIPFCYAEAAANVLTNPVLDPFGKIPEFKFCAAKVEKISSVPADKLKDALLGAHA
jgi:formate dehydrogenase major subunit